LRLHEKYCRKNPDNIGETLKSMKKELTIPLSKTGLTPLNEVEQLARNIVDDSTENTSQPTPEAAQHFIEKVSTYDTYNKRQLALELAKRDAELEQLKKESDSNSISTFGDNTNFDLNELAKFAERMKILQLKMRMMNEAYSPDGHEKKDDVPSYRELMFMDKIDDRAEERRRKREPNQPQPDPTIPLLLTQYASANDRLIQVLAEKKDISGELTNLIKVGDLLAKKWKGKEEKSPAEQIISSFGDSMGGQVFMQQLGAAVGDKIKTVQMPQKPQVSFTRDSESKINEIIERPQQPQTVITPEEYETIQKMRQQQIEQPQTEQTEAAKEPELQFKDLVNLSEED